MDRKSNEEVINDVKRFLKKVNNKYKIEKALLFGSRSRDDWLYSSDIDLILVSKDFKNIHFLDRIRNVSQLWDGMLELQVICYTPEEFKRKSTQIGTIQEAVKTGKELAFT